MAQQNIKNQTDWVERAHWFAVRVIRLSANLPRTPAGLPASKELAELLQEADELAAMLTTGTKKLQARIQTST